MPQIQLRNGRILDAVELESNTYEVTLASGKTRVYTSENILRVIIDDLHVDDTTTFITKEDRMLFHYLQEFTVNGERVTHRFITDHLPETIVTRYMLSVATKRAQDGVLALSMGTYHFSLIEEELMKRHERFTVMIVRNADLKLYPPNKVDEWVNKATFAHANASYSFFLKVESCDWGLGCFDMSLDMKKKSAKRAQELYRDSEMSLHLQGDEMETLDIAIKEMEGLDPKLFDGMSYVRQSVVIRAIKQGVLDKVRRGRLISAVRRGKLVRVTLRVLTPNGLIKGDAIIVPDSQIDADIVTHIENLKTEILSGDFIHITMWEHHTYHNAIWDDQSTINFGKAMPEWKHMADLHMLRDNFLNALHAGYIPEWIKGGEQAHTDDGTMDHEPMSVSRDRQWEKWQAAGGDIRALQNIIYMVEMALVNRMRAAREIHVGNDTFFKKMWIPMSNAVLASVVTYESLTLMGGFEFDDRDPNTVFFDERCGMVIPGRRFIETFDPHGTWDLDDSAKFVWIKLFASGDHDIHKGVTIPVDMDLPATAEEAIDALLVVRSPNGPGEYSIELPDLDGLFPELDFVNLDTVVSVDLCTLPAPQAVLLNGTQVTGLPTSTVYSGTDITPNDAINMIKAQMNNPGVGAFCNAMMVWAAIMGPSFPMVMSDVMGNIVDAAQQGFDLAAFNVIETEPARILEMLTTAMENNTNLKLDRAIAATRVGDPAFRLTIQPRLFDGRLTRVQREYRKVINEIINEVKNNAMQWRYNTDLVQSLRRISFGADILTWSQKFFSEYTEKLVVAEHTFDNLVKSTNPFIRSHGLYEKKLAMEAVVTEMVNVFMAMTEPERHRHVLGFYKWLVLADHGSQEPWGKHDRLVCQPNSQGASVLDLLIEAIQFYGLGTTES